MEQQDANVSASESGSGVDLDALDVSLDPVSEIEKDLSEQMEAGGSERDRAEEQLRYSGGIHQALKYMEKSVPIEGFGPDEQDSDARKDLAIVLGNLLYKYEYSWLTEYEDEIFAVGLAFVLYGGPVLRQLGPKIWRWYTSKVLQSSGETGSSDGSAREEKDGEKRDREGG